MRVFLPKSYLLLLKIALLSLIIGALMRLVMFIANRALIGDEPLVDQLYAFSNGIRYDLVITCYILALPTLFTIVVSTFNFKSKALYVFSKIWYTLFIGFILLVSIVDIPFFDFYNARLNTAIFSWVGHPALMFKAIFTNWWYVIFVILGILLLYLWYRFIKKIIDAHGNYSQPQRAHVLSKILLPPLFLTALFFGMRGVVHLNWKPLGIKHAYYCNNSFLNQLCLNPTFSLIESARDNTLNFMDDQLAKEKVEGYLEIPKGKSEFSREYRFAGDPKPFNVVVILLESMSAHQLAYYGNQQELTPFLDSLTHQSLFFPNTYSSGIHTFNGIFSTLFAMPALMKFNPMIHVATANQRFQGIPTVLNEAGYATFYACTNSKDFDNVGGFMSKNGFDDILSLESFPESEVVNGWGVSDHYLLEQSVLKMNQLAKQKKPFFSTIMTISTHEPHVIPKGIPFKPKAKEMKDKIYQYSDWTIKHFFDLAKKQPWFDQTIFVLMADHGQNFDPTYEMPLSYHHIPLYFYAPNWIQPEVRNQIVLQMDVFPTLMHFLNRSYENKTMGLDLLKDKPRPYAFFASDDKIGVLDTSLFYIWRKGGGDALFHHPTKATNDIKSQNSSKIKEMQDYGFSMLQRTQYLMRNK